MGILTKLLSLMPPPKGVRLDIRRPFWEVSGDTDFPSVLAALPDLLPDGSVLYFEGGSASAELLVFLRAHQVQARAHVARGIIWPKPAIYHLPATRDIIMPLAELMRTRAYPELAVHFHAYCDQAVLLEWHDAFTNPMLLSAEIPEQRVRAFAERLQMSFQRGSVEPTVGANGVSG